MACGVVVGTGETTNSKEATVRRLRVKMVALAVGDCSSATVPLGMPSLIANEDDLEDPAGIAG
jgi:hypothetical protein